MASEPRLQGAPAAGEGIRPLAMLLAAGAGVLRVIPHPWNFAPVGALGIFAGARLRWWHALLLTLTIRVATDGILLLIKGFEVAPALYWSFMPFVYLSLVGNVLLGRWLSRTESSLKIAGVTLLGSLQFFLLTNFGTWLMTTDMYPHTPAGLLACYVAAIPFFGGTLAGDCLYSGVLFGLHAWLTRTAFPRERVPALASELPA